MTISTLDFFQALYGEDGPDGEPYLLLLDEGTTPRPRVLWPSTIEAASAIAGRESGAHHVYFGVCPASEKLGGNQKPKAKLHIGAVHALWMDIDIGKHGVPETRELALAAVEKCPLRPTILVDSGNGYHAYWVLKEAINIAGDAVANEEAERLTKAWQKFFSTHSGYRFDSTGNLDRVLRVPGTMNIKPNSGLMCEAVYTDGPQYLRGDFDQYVDIEPVDPEEINKLQRAPGSLYSVRPGEMFDQPIEFPKIPGLQIEGVGMYIPFENIGPGSHQAIDSMREQFHAFRKMFNDPRDKNGRPIKAHDLSRDFTTALRLYINWCVNEGISPERQVCFDLNTYVRGVNWSKPEDLSKAYLRPGWTESVIKSFADSTKPLPKREGESEGGTSGCAPEAEPQKKAKKARRHVRDDPGDIAAARATLEDLCGAQIGDVLRLMGTTPQEYSIEVFVPGQDEPCMIYVSVEQILTWKKFHSAWISATGQDIRNVVTTSEWEKRCVPRLLRIAAPNYDTPEETTEIGQVRLAMIAYLHSHSVMASVQEAYPTSQPFRGQVGGLDGVWYFSGPLSEFVAQALKGDGLTPRKVCSIIKRNNLCKDKQANFVNDDGVAIKPRVYRFPDDVVKRAGLLQKSAFGIKSDDYLKEEGDAPCFTDESQPTQ